MSGLDLYLDQRVLFTMLLVAFTVGAALSVLYDTLAVFIRLLPGKSNRNGADMVAPRGRSFLQIGIRFFTDLLFSLIAAISFLLVCYYTSDGQVRSPAVMGIIGGFLLCRCVLGGLYRRLLHVFLRFLYGMLRRILLCVIGVAAFFWRKIVWSVLLRPLWLVARWLFDRTIARIIRHHRVRNTERLRRRLTGDAAHGFELGETPPDAMKDPQSSV